MKFTIQIITRKRLNLLNNLIKSISEKTKEKSEIELHIIYDFDDEETRGYTLSVNEKYPDLNIEVHPTNRSAWMLRDYVNWGVFNFAKGKYIMSLNDDVIFINQDWDIATWNKLENYLSDKPDGVVYGNVEDSEESKLVNAPITQGQFSCFPIISRAAINALGWFYDNEYNSWSSDVAIYLVYREINRICDLRKELILYHISTHSKRREPDTVFQEMANNNQGGPEPTAFVSRDVEILRNYIKNYKI
jgi:hypothetical protein